MNKYPNNGWSSWYVRLRTALAVMRNESVIFNTRFAMSAEGPTRVTPIAPGSEGFLLVECCLFAPDPENPPVGPSIVFGDGIGYER